MVAMKEKTEYELAREERMRKNKIMLQSIGVDIEAELMRKDLKTPPKPRGQQKRKPEVSVIARKSERTAGTPRPSYADLDGMREPKGTREGGDNRLSRSSFSVSAEMKEADEKAVELAEGLGSPACIKFLQPSQISGGFWMSLQRAFCRDNMPAEKDEFVILSGHGGVAWEVRFLAAKNGLSGNWRGFSIDHRLEAGDCAVFEKVQQQPMIELKVHIVRASRVDPDLGPFRYSIESGFVPPGLTAEQKEERKARLSLWEKESVERLSGEEVEERERVLERLQVLRGKGETKKGGLGRGVGERKGVEEVEKGGGGKRSGEEEAQSGDNQTKKLKGVGGKGGTGGKGEKGKKGATKIGREVKGEEAKGSGGMGEGGKEGKMVQTKRKPKLMRLEDIGRGKKKANVKGG